MRRRNKLTPIHCERRELPDGRVYEVTELGDGSGRVIQHHPQEKCEPGSCPFHRPSDHIMASWPMTLRESGLIERVCVHNVGHPDPDSLSYFDRRDQGALGVHGCDGCCRSPLAVLDRMVDRITSMTEELAE